MTNRADIYTLFTPGPIQIPGWVYRELSLPLVYHREERFYRLLTEVRKGLKSIFKTDSEVFLLTGSGTGGMEAAVVNLVSPGDLVLVASCGRFGDRWVDLCQNFGARVRSQRVELGRSVDPQAVEDALRAEPEIRFVFTTLTETSTGALNDLQALGRIVRAQERILVVDAVAGLGADEFRMDEWGLDLAVAGSQKALAAPPGIAILAVGERALRLIERAKAPRFYWDLRKYRTSLERRQTPYTPAIPVLYALRATLRRLEREGVEGAWARHHQAAQFFRERVARLGLGLLPESPSNALTVVRMPQGVDGREVVEFAKRRHRILFANGQGELSGRVVRIGHMGWIPRRELERAWRAFKEAMEAMRGRNYR